ncbi:MAG: SOS response-associated peptidase [Candidatus Methylacidiphilales bacterium]
MCFTIKQSKEPKELEQRFKAKNKFNLNIISDNINGFTFPKTSVISNQNPNEIQLFHWGLLPSFTQDMGFIKNTLNAKIETLEEKPSFKNSIQNRCLIIADGFYEWQWLDKAGKKKQKYLIELPNQDLFCFAGIYNQWVNKLTGETLNTFAMLTTEANPLMAEIHNSKKRMPVILTPQNENLWLGGNNKNEFIKPEITLNAIKINESKNYTLF